MSMDGALSGKSKGWHSYSRMCAGRRHPESLNEAAENKTSTLGNEIPTPEEKKETGSVAYD